MGDLPRIAIQRRVGTEPVHDGGNAIGGDLLDFWRWSGSDLVTNTNRGILAEYLVALALDAGTNGVRDPWAPFDLTTPAGTTVEVKSGAYLQSWHQHALTTVQFSCAKTRAWDADSNALAADQQRQAQVYVFALLAHRDKQSIDPLDVSQWEFWVVPTAKLNERTRSQVSITLPSLRALVGASVRFAQLRAAVAAAA